MESLPPEAGGSMMDMEILTPNSDDESTTSSPVPTLTIGQVLDALPKLKQGRKVIFFSILFKAWIYFQLQPQT